MPTQRELTDWEIADLLAFHPEVAAMVTETKIAIATIGYDQTSGQSDLIPPQGYAFNDTTYGTVLIFFGADGTMHVSGWTSVNPATVNAPKYNSPDPNAPDLSTLIVVGLVGLGALLFLTRR